MIKILIVEDSIFTCRMISNLLSEPNVEIVSVYSAEEAFEYLEEQVPDIILLAMVLPDMNGCEACTKIKSSASLIDVPVIFLTSYNDETSIVRGFEAGATDYITKPFRQTELKARVLCHAQNKQMSAQLRVTNSMLEKMMEELKLQGYKDPLTNLYNRKYILEEMIAWKKQNTETRKNAFLFMMDVDKFKTINDTYGHATGDYALYTLADILRKSVNGDAVIGRWGGDEFLIFLLDTNSEAAKEVAENIRKNVAAYSFAYEDNSFTCSVTIGTTPFDPGLRIEENLELADKALYAGKDKGRNCISFE